VARDPNAIVHSRFRTRYGNHELYDVVRDAVQRLRPREPELVTQREFDAARPSLGIPDCPSARQICTRLRTGWPALLELVCDPTRSPTRAQEAAEREEPAWHLDNRWIHYALNKVARERGADSLSDIEYQWTRDLLISRDAHRWKHGGLAIETLPSRSQISVFCGSWAKACQLAGLAPPERGGLTTGLPLPKAIDQFIEATGYLCSYNQLDEFAAEFDFALALKKKGGKWSTELAAAAKLRAERGSSMPSEYWPKSQPLEYVNPPAEIPGAAPRNRRDYWTKPLVLAAFRGYLAAKPPTVRPTTADYKSRRALHPHWPALSRTQQFGLFHQLLKEAAQPPSEDLPIPF